MNQETIKAILSKFGYEYFNDSNGGYFLPIRRRIKFATKIPMEEAVNRFTVDETKTKKPTNKLKKNG